MSSEYTMVSGVHSNKHIDYYNPDEKEKWTWTWKEKLAAGVGATGLLVLTGLGGLGAFAAFRFKVAPPNQFIAKTGFLVKGIHVSRKTLQLPFQTINRYDMRPQTYQFIGKNIMSKELIGFELPVKFNIAPIHPEHNLEGFINYVTRVGSMPQEEKDALIENIIIGKTREYTSNMTIIDMVENKDAFKKGVVAHIAEELEENGFQATSANISDIADPPGVDYFKNLMKKATSEANTKSSIDVAEAEKTRIVGEKNREVETRKQQYTLEAQAKQIESQQSQNISEYERDLEIMRTNNKQKEDLAKIESHKATELRQIAVESELNQHRQQQELERLRSQKVILAIAEAEAVLKTAQMEADAIKIKAEAQSVAIKIQADADLFDKTKIAEALYVTQSRQAEADFISTERQAQAKFITQSKQAEADLVSKEKEAEAIKLVAEANLIAKNKEAIGVQALLKAQAAGLQEFYESANENPEMASLHLLTTQGHVFDKDGLFDRIAKHQADAIHGLEPKINIWNTGSDSKTQYTDVISDLAKVTPPILDAIKQQTGIDLLGCLPSSMQTNMKTTRE